MTGWEKINDIKNNIDDIYMYTLKFTKNYPTMCVGTIFNYESVIISCINSRCLISNWKGNG